MEARDKKATVSENERRKVKEKEREREIRTYFAIDVPVLHHVRNIASLDQVLNDNRSLAMNGIFHALTACKRFRECLFPSSITQVLELLIYNISGHDTVHRQLAEALQLNIIRIDSTPKCLVLWIQEQSKGQIYRVLLSNALATVRKGH